MRLIFILAAVHLAVTVSAAVFAYSSTMKRFDDINHRYGPLERAARSPASVLIQPGQLLWGNRPSELSPMFSNGVSSR